MGLRGALTLLQEQAAATDHDRAMAGICRIDPRLVTCYQPSKLRPAAGTVPPGPSMVECGGPQAPAAGGPAGAPPGLVRSAKSAKPVQRQGSKGLTANGARQIQRSCCWLNDQRRQLAFWTVTLPDATIRRMMQEDRWPEFQSRIRDLLVRALQAAGLQPLVIGVVELHPGRSFRDRRPLPHIHVVFVGRSRPTGPWALSTTTLDRIIRDAVRYVGLPAPDVSAAGNVQPVRKNCGAYLAKYMRKNRNLCRWCVPAGSLPKIWWFWSKPLRLAIMASILEISWGLIAWLHRQPVEQLQAIGCHRQRLEIPDPRAPATWLVSLRGPAAVARLLACWRADLLQAECEGTTFPVHGCS